MAQCTSKERPLHYTKGWLFQIFQLVGINDKAKLKRSDINVGVKHCIILNCSNCFIPAVTYICNHLSVEMKLSKAFLLKYSLQGVPKPSGKIMEIPEGREEGYDKHPHLPQRKVPSMERVWMFSGQQHNLEEFYFQLANINNILVGHKTFNCKNMTTLISSA